MGRSRADYAGRDFYRGKCKVTLNKEIGTSREEACPLIAESFSPVWYHYPQLIPSEIQGVQDTYLESNSIEGNLFNRSARLIRAKIFHRIVKGKLRAQEGYPVYTSSTQVAILSRR